MWIIFHFAQNYILHKTMDTPLTPKQRQQFKQQAHSLRPVVLIGQNGLTEAVIRETDGALQAHGLIKIKIAADDRAERLAVTGKLAAQLGAQIIGVTGKTAVLYRAAEDTGQ